MLRIGDEVDRLYLVDRQVHGNEDIFMGEEHFEPIFFIFFREEGRAERMPYSFSYFNALNFYYSNFNMGYSSMVRNVTNVDQIPEIYARMQRKCFQQSVLHVGSSLQVFRSHLLTLHFTRPSYSY